MKIRELNITTHRNLYAYPSHPPKWPPWLFDEAKACGDHNSKIKARTYDNLHGRFRQFDQEAQQIIEHLALTCDHTVLDIGCGTGGFCVHAAPYVKTIYAMDISKAMLRIAKKKAKKLKLDNVHFNQGSLLKFKLTPPVDAVVCTVMLHHLPDFWKLIALKRLRSVLKPGGCLYLFDVVFSFDPNGYSKHISNWINDLDKRSWTLAEHAFKHVKYEYSTYAWIMEGLLKQAGFILTKAEYPTDMTAVYVASVDHP